ncbi:MAG: hypothetical protein FD162_2830 [Rhodobacteraceae bacterium]|uniref:nucleotidyltransferase family protein n=1 Tax=Cypionkella sp. TaxID=2811411 RepID=UPI001326973F|nr:nucleotidyltransferase family protein [Cypionkella sp.]KAF0171746.1 MAG: hypothetical protein FD162_2830 [Paracoccaceae bacterium]MDO8327774.1 nucleotidyltransferase family protein [Cypionkella sp.]
MTLTILIPAAGTASRMRGGDKLLEEVGGEPMLRRQARLARLVCAAVIVTLRPEDSMRHKALEALDITALPVPDAAEGMAASIRAGASAAQGAVMILPGDMPELTAADLRAVIDAFDQDRSAICRGTAADGTPGHPVILPADLRAELLALRGDEGARKLLQRHKARVRLIALPDQHAITDLDTPEAWAIWRAHNR